MMNDMAGRASERATQVAARTMCADGVADAAAVARWVLWVVDWWVGGVWWWCMTTTVAAAPSPPLRHES